MDTIHLPQDFRDFLKLLNFHKAEYLQFGTPKNKQESDRKAQRPE